MGNFAIAAILSDIHSVVVIVVFVGEKCITQLSLNLIALDIEENGYVSLWCLLACMMHQVNNCDG